MVTNPNSIQVLTEPYSQASKSCPSGNWDSLINNPANDLGYPTSVGPFVDPFDAPPSGQANNGGAASLAVKRFAYTDSTNVQDGF